MITYNQYNAEAFELLCEPPHAAPPDTNGWYWNDELVLCNINGNTEWWVLHCIRAGLSIDEIVIVRGLIDAIGRDHISHIIDVYMHYYHGIHVEAYTTISQQLSDILCKYVQSELPEPGIWEGFERPPRQIGRPMEVPPWVRDRRRDLMVRHRSKQ